MLHYFRGQERLTAFTLGRARVLIGRSDACDIVVPGTAISRTHAVLEPTDDGWDLISRGRHGTQVNDSTVQGRTTLHDGDVIGVAPFHLVFDTKTPQKRASFTSTTAAPAPTSRLLTLEGSLVLETVVAEVTEGPDSGRRLRLDKPSQTIGGRGSDHELGDTTLLPRHLRIVLRHGRPMVRDPAGPVIIDGVRVGGGTLPIYPNEPVRIGQTVLRMRTELVHADPKIERLGDMVGESDAMQRLFGVLHRMAAFPAPVLILGESGTGKELAARGLHDVSPRAERPFVAVNCGAIAATLFESELFGHEKGAFTGAEKRRDGAFHQADGGTLFLDEVGELPEAAQTKLLRVLESGEVRRVGGSVVSYPDVRVVAATNRDLQKEVDAGRFRQDLYFRLAVLAVRIAPLRERPDDLKLLCRTLCARLGPEVHLLPESLEVLRAHPYPGNVRELKNVLTRAFVLGGPLIRPESVSFNPWSFDAPPPASARDSGLSVARKAERDLLLQTLARHNGNRSAAARELGLARSTLLYKMRRLDIALDDAATG